MTPTRTFTTEAIIDASAAEVWEVMADMNRWHRWNIYPFRARTEPTPGARLWFGPLFPIPFGRFRAVDPGRELAWGGRVGRLFDVTHGMTLVPLADGRVRLVNREHLTGPLIAVIPKAIAPLWCAVIGTFDKGLARRMRTLDAARGRGA
ncbi:SRPBCC family protein [Nocardia sp. CDC160]|uniref:SRPBCC family protein n=1 Tax=Nocardia sp. CDC160 TaxID=3112166 RepID=UPI002DBC373E|nr:SRPBCC family protein [Nocardia sp. CDC160]MEC3919363.1 SRPBCC family protein [Nocardia sp. CDC160]